ncbi:MAG: histidine kinase [Chitinophagaceae bacterium]|nr:MAG: histidine kinase [Chitinophagaceae bacterium]
MTRKQRFWAYAAVFVLLVWGLELLNALKYNKAANWTDLFNIFTLSSCVYILGTLLATRQVLLRVQGRWTHLLYWLPLLIVAFVLVRFGLEELLFPVLFGFRNYSAETPFFFYFLDNIYYAAVYIVLGSLLFFADEWLAAKGRQAELLVRNREAELAFLRMQVNPHFLFNSLNNIYALSYKGSPKAPEAILKLAELMRYMLYEKKTLLPLSTEWEYVQHFIALQQLRYDYPLTVDLQVEGDLAYWEVPPYLLIAFVENAFKHGDLQGKALQLQLNANEQQLDFRLHNAVGRHQKDDSNGIGLQNLRRRLELLYPGQHQLRAEEKSGNFTVHLTLTR